MARQTSGGPDGGGGRPARRPAARGGGARAGRPGGESGGAGRDRRRRCSAGRTPSWNRGAYPARGRCTKGRPGSPAPSAGCRPGSGRVAANRSVDHTGGPHHGPWWFWPSARGSGIGGRVGPPRRRRRRYAGSAADDADRARSGRVTTALADGDSLRYYPAYAFPAARRLPPQDPEAAAGRACSCCWRSGSTAASPSGTPTPTPSRSASRGRAALRAPGRRGRIGCSAGRCPRSSGAGPGVYASSPTPRLVRPGHAGARRRPGHRARRARDDLRAGHRRADLG